VPSIRPPARRFPHAARFDKSRCGQTSYIHNCRAGIRGELAAEETAQFGDSPWLPTLARTSSATAIAGIDLRETRGMPALANLTMNLDGRECQLALRATESKQTSKRIVLLDPAGTISCKPLAPVPSQAVPALAFQHWVLNWSASIVTVCVQPALSLRSIQLDV
jgi:hypothetical protein